jgi:small redox-active disulfide protein 2
MKIQVLGSGCPTCAKLNDAVIKAVEEMGLIEKVEYLTGFLGTSKIIELGAMSSPVLAINDKIAMVGFTPDLEKIKEIIGKFKGEK